VHVADNANNFTHETVRTVGEVAADRIRIREEALRGRLVDDRDRRRLVVARLSNSRPAAISRVTVIAVSDAASTL
jgi:hypothetical protein